jgi:hypothetical protein
MRQGRFEDAWRLSDRMCAVRRIDTECRRPRHFQIIWDGSRVENRRVLIRCYHGLGDTLQFARYLPMVHRLARELTVWAQPTLIPLLQASFPPIVFLPLHDGTPEVEYDVDLEIMELAHAFRTSITTIPADVPYLTVDVTPMHRSRPLVGLTWRAGNWDDNRSVPFDLVSHLTESADVDVIPLQPSLTREEFIRFQGRTLLTTIDELAPHIAACDLVVSVDTMSAHLAGALNVPVWTMLKHEADWRWMIDRDDSPWYPSMRLYRQATPGDWWPVIERMADDLREFAVQRRNGPTRAQAGVPLRISG